MEVTIKLSALSRDEGSLSMPLTAGATVGDALDYVAVKRPSLSLDRDAVIVTANDELVQPDRELASGDVINIIPVIEGG